MSLAAFVRFPLPFAAATSLVFSTRLRLSECSGVIVEDAWFAGDAGYFW